MSAQKQTQQNARAQTQTSVHGYRRVHTNTRRETEREKKITRLVVLSFTVIQHHGQQHVCSNRDKT